MITRDKFFIKRNVQIIREFKSLREKGFKVRDIYKDMKERYGLGKSLIQAVIYQRETYPYAGQAWKIIDNEEKEAKAKESVDLSKS